jgi:RNA polymerase sigma-32 factor
MAACVRNSTRSSWDTGLAHYLSEVHKFPMLGAEEEVALAKQWHEHRDQDAAHRLVASHLRLVVRIATGFRGYGLPIGDLIAEGDIGMMRAVKGFDPDRGVRLATYAIWWIRAVIQEYILHNWSLVKIGTTAAQKKLFFKLRRKKNVIRAVDARDLSPEHVTQIANLLEVPAEDVIAMTHRLAERDSSLNAPLTAGEDGQWQDFLVDDSPSQEERLGDYEELVRRRRLLSQALTTLNGRERHILVGRHLKEEPLTLDALGKTYGISRERVRQVEIIAYEKLEKAIRSARGTCDVFA